MSICKLTVVEFDVFMEGDFGLIFEQTLTMCMREEECSRSALQYSNHQLHVVIKNQFKLRGAISIKILGFEDCKLP